MIELERMWLELGENALAVLFCQPTLVSSTPVSDCDVALLYHQAFPKKNEYGSGSRWPLNYYTHNCTKHFTVSPSIHIITCETELELAPLCK